MLITSSPIRRYLRVDYNVCDENFEKHLYMLQIAQLE